MIWEQIFSFWLVGCLIQSYFSFITQNLSVLWILMSLECFFRLLYYLRFLGFHRTWIDKRPYSLALQQRFLIIFRIFFVYGFRLIFYLTFFAERSNRANRYVFILAIFHFFLFNNFIINSISFISLLFIWEIEEITLSTCHVFAQIIMRSLVYKSWIYRRVFSGV